MGHQFPRAVVAAALVLAGCGGSGGDGDPPPVLDVAREQVAAVGTTDATGGETAGERGADETAPDELPPPDPSTYAGAHRVVNLFAETGADGTVPTAIDVWARRTFTHGPVLLAEGVEFAQATAYFAAPVGADVVIVGAGAGPDGEQRAGLPDLTGDEQATTVFTNGDGASGETALQLGESGVDLTPVPPAADHGIVVVVAANLEAFDEELRSSVGGAEFLVGDGTAMCRVQRIESTGAAAEVVGASARVEFEVAPGPAVLSLHPASSPNGCDQPSTVDVTVEVAAGGTTTVLVYTRDGTALSTLLLPTGR